MTTFRICLSFQIFDQTRQVTDIFLPLSRKPLDAALDSQGETSITDFVLKDEFIRSTTAQVLRSSAALRIPMLGEPPGDVCRNTGVKAAVRTAKQVDAPGRHDQSGLGDASCRRRVFFEQPGWPDWPWLHVATTVGTNSLQHLIDATPAKRAFE